jgi:hypothetical protein
MINLAKLERATKPHRGFGTHPRRWLQVLGDDTEQTTGHNGDDEALHRYCAALLQTSPDAVILVLDGACDLSNPDIIAEYRTDRAVIGAEHQVMMSVREVAQLVK